MKLPTDVQMGTLGGTLSTLLYQFAMHDLLQTMLTAAVGAAVSYWVSRLLRDSEGV